MWKKAKVVAVNYDGTYDLQFEMNHGPYREQRMKGLKGKPTLSLRREEQFKGYAADHMPVPRKKESPSEESFSVCEGCTWIS